MSNEYAESGFYTRKEKSTGTICCSFLCSNLGLFVVVALYAVVGAYAFIAIEKPNELKAFDRKQLRAKEVWDTKEYLGRFFWYYQDKAVSSDDYKEMVTVELDQLEQYIIDSVSQFKYDGTLNGWVHSWTFPKSLLFTMTVMSTIGYGHIYPVTDEGKIFCIFYAIVGCSLLLIFLGNIGNSIADTFISAYSRVCCRWCRSRRNDEELPPHTSKKQRKLLVDDVVGKEEYMPTDSIMVPIVINLTLLMLHILLGAVLFKSWEGWSLTDSSYFTFVTISTIGYGDMVPGSAILDGNDADGTIRMFICIIYIVLGMALLSTCINLMQEQILEKCHWLAKEIGLSKPDKEDQDKNKSKNIHKKPTKERKKQPRTIPEGNENSSPPVIAAPSLPSAGRLRRRPSQDNVPSPHADSNTLSLPKTSVFNPADSRSPSPSLGRSNCPTPIPGFLNDSD